ncbi:MAG: hypothetical protein JST05_07975 [Acidobacteria bacterium]|nr:hypothetical protein [Acidobacteriota bacterium]
MKRAALLLLFALPASAQSFADGTAFGGSRVFSSGENPMGNAARFDQLPEGVYLGADWGDLTPHGFAQASSGLVAAEGDPTLLPSALSGLSRHPWAQREQRYGLAWAWTGGLRVGYTHEDSRGVFATTEPASDNATLDARQAVVDRLYAGAGSQAGRSALGFTVRVDRVRFGQDAAALQPLPGQASLGDPSAPLNGLPLDHSVTSATVDLGYLFEFSQAVRGGITLDRLAGRRYGDIKEEPQARAGLQVDVTPSMRLALESDLNAAERLPFARKARVSAASLRLDLSGTAFLTIGAERRSFQDASAATTFGASFHYRMAPLMLSFGLRLGDDRPFAAAAFRLPGG